MNYKYLKNQNKEQKPKPKQLSNLQQMCQAMDRIMGKK